jgi:hypothetical protein
VAYLARCALQRLGREAPPFATGGEQSIFVDAAGRLLACDHGASVGHGRLGYYFYLSPVYAMIGIRVRSVAAGRAHRLALTWHDRVCSWGNNDHGQLGQGDKLAKLAPALMEGLGGICRIAAAGDYSLAVTQSGDVFRWGCALLPEGKQSRRPIIVKGFGDVRVRCVRAESDTLSPLARPGSSSRGGMAEAGTSATATRMLSACRGESSRCGASR